MADPELAFAEALARSLGARGLAKLVYITAEMQPFSNQQRPDIVFTPRAGPFAAQMIFIEIKLSTKPLKEARAYLNLLDHKEFAADALERGVGRYVFVTSQEIPPFTERYLDEHGIIALGGVKSVEQLIEELSSLGLLVPN